MNLLALLATLAALLSGPLLYALARRRPAFLAFLDGFVLVSIAGLVLLEVVPGAYGEGGLWSLAFLALGAVGPTLVEHTLHRARREAHLATLALAVFGLLLHSLGDGVALSPGHHVHDDHVHAPDALALAVVVHSVPVGLVVWWVMAPVFGARWPAATLALMCLGTVLGYHYGLHLSDLLGARAFAWFQALVAGSILHVVFGRPHLEEDSQHRHGPPPFEGLGNVVALLGLLALARLGPHDGPVAAFGLAALQLGLLLAPALLVLYALSGVIAALGARPGTRRSAGLRMALVTAPDRSAARVLFGLLALTGADLLLRTGGAPAAARLLHAHAWLWAPGALVALLFLASLLRRGGRRWLSSLTGPAHRHAH